MLLAALLIGASGFVFRHSLLPDATAPRAEAATEPPMTVSVATAATRPIARRIIAGGTLVAREEALVAARIEGASVESVLVDVGDRVAEGQPLATLDGRRLALRLAQKRAQAARAEAAIAQARALLAEAEAGAREARLAFERAEALRGAGSASAQALEARETAAAATAARAEAQRQALAAAAAELRQIAAEADEIAWERDRTTVRATADGLILEREARVGQITAADDAPLFRILRDGAVEMEALVAERALPAIRAGQPATVSIAGGPPVEGVVRLVSPVVDAAARMGRVRIALSQKDAWPGASARAVFDAEAREAIVLPRAAVLAGEDGPRVQVVERGVVTLRAVETGIADAEGVEIVAGLHPGEVVVAGAGALLREGSRVAPAPAAPEEGVR